MNSLLIFSAFLVVVGSHSHNAQVMCYVLQCTWFTNIPVAVFILQGNKVRYVSSSFLPQENLQHSQGVPSERTWIYRKHNQQQHSFQNFTTTLWTTITYLWFNTTHRRVTPLRDMRPFVQSDFAFEIRRTSCSQSYKQTLNDSLSPVGISGALSGWFVLSVSNNSIWFLGTVSGRPGISQVDPKLFMGRRSFPSTGDWTWTLTSVCTI